MTALGWAIATIGVGIMFYAAIELITDYLAARDVEVLSEREARRIAWRE